jgi:hypothetical protein
MSTMSHRNVRVDDELWERAGTRAADEDTTLSKLIRQWLSDYANGSMARVPLSESERQALDLILNQR